MDYSVVAPGPGLHAWTPIGQTSNQLILYHPPSHALQVRPHSPSSVPSPTAGPSRLPLRILGSPPIENITTVPHCPYCSQPLPTTGPVPRDLGDNRDGPLDDAPERASPLTNGTRYFQILEQAHEGSRPPSPTPSTPRRYATTPTPEPGPRPDRYSQAEDDVLDEADLPARGYYERFFKEEKKLGMGAEGSVFLATHVIGGNVLGTYAVKKIAVGSSKSYLFKMLREVRLLEALRHPNIIPYHHSWIDTTRFSSFGPPIIALHVLMMYATAGNLDTYLLTRSHSTAQRSDLSANDIGDNESLGQLPRAERIKAFKKRRQSAVDGAAGARRRKEENRGVLLLGVEEIAKLFGDVVEGLAFLHANSILHLDLKCSNVLLHWEEGRLTPKALISDFGTSEEMLRGQHVRTGHTGTMEYMAPETLVQDTSGQWRPSDSHADMWSLGMILHKMLFLHLPYPDTEDYDALLREILAYPGFIPTSDLFQSLERRHIPRDLLILLSKLAHVVPEERPTAERVRVGLRGLEDRARSTGFARAGELVRRFVSPFTAVEGDNEGATGVARSENPWSRTEREKPDHIHSPVRPILALPSPEDERSPASLSLGSTEARSRGQATGMDRFIGPLSGHTARPGILQLRRRYGGKVIRGALFFIKVISLQPQFEFSEHLPPTYTLLLLILAVVELVGEVSYLWALGLGGLHLGVMYGVGGSGSGRE